MTVSIPDDEITVLIAGDVTRAPAKALFIQNFSLTVGFWLKAIPGHNPDADSVVVGEDLYLGPAASATTPTTLFTDTPSLAAAKWLARQDSGGAVNLNVGRF